MAAACRHASIVIMIGVAKRRGGERRPYIELGLQSSISTGIHSLTLAATVGRLGIKPCHLGLKEFDAVGTADGRFQRGQAVFA